MDWTVWLTIAAVVALGLAITAGVLLVRVFAARRLLLDAGIPLRDKALFWVAVIYTISPVDLIPDPVYLDDIGVLLLALRSLHAAASAVRQPGALSAPGAAKAPEPRSAKEPDPA
ncbi:YkvA family protein [Streptomyces roseus]|uniref:Membrane protein n=1 Tax=Streptomyces roseus TaxID=66430 RepID=A0A0J6XJK8_9ACTN|nr:YkvA family protein [Streptomyces roseus]KMO94432.1 membrane protein [Streptomyces roseus]